MSLKLQHDRNKIWVNPILLLYEFIFLWSQLLESPLGGGVVIMITHLLSIPQGDRAMCFVLISETASWHHVRGGEVHGSRQRLSHIVFSCRSVCVTRDFQDRALPASSPCGWLTLGHKLEFLTCGLPFGALGPTFGSISLGSMPAVVGRKTRGLDECEWSPPPMVTPAPPPSLNSVKDCRKWFARLEVISALRPFWEMNLQFSKDRLCKTEGGSPQGPFNSNSLETRDLLGGGGGPAAPPHPLEQLPVPEWAQSTPHSCARLRFQIPS